MTYRVINVGVLIPPKIKFTLYEVQYTLKYEPKRAEVLMQPLPYLLTHSTSGYSIACL